MANVTMPQLGETVADGTVTKWFKNVGDTLVKGEPLFEVSTDKVDTEIPSPMNGVLSAILVEEGMTVDVGTVLAVIGDGLDEPATAAPTAINHARGDKRRDPSSATVEKKTPPKKHNCRPSCGDSSKRTVSTSPRSPALGQTDASLVKTYSRLSSRHGFEPRNGGAQSPILRRLMSQHNIDVKDVVGHRTQRVDHSSRRRRVDQSGPARLLASGARDEVDSLHQDSTTHRGTHGAIEGHLRTHADGQRDRLRTRGTRASRRFATSFKESEGFSLSYLPFNAVAAIEALRDFPRLNASVGHDELIVHLDVNLGIAVDIDNEGLVVPSSETRNGSTWNNSREAYETSPSEHEQSG